MAKLEKEKDIRPTVTGKIWTEDMLIELDKQIEPYREETEINGKKIRYLSKEGMHAFLKTVGALSQFSRSDKHWKVKVGGYSKFNGEYTITSNPYEDYLVGINQLEKIK